MFNEVLSPSLASLIPQLNYTNYVDLDEFLVIKTHLFLFWE